MKLEEHAHRPNKWYITNECHTLTFVAFMIHNLMCARDTQEVRNYGMQGFQHFRSCLALPMADWQVQRVSAVAGNWHAWLLPPADWKLNMSFVSQGWVFIQSRPGIRSNASWGFDFMQKRSLKCTQLAWLWRCVDFTVLFFITNPLSSIIIVCQLTSQLLITWVIKWKELFGISVTFDRLAPLHAKGQNATSKFYNSFMTALKLMS